MINFKLIFSSNKKIWIFLGLALVVLLSLGLFLMASNKGKAPKETPKAVEEFKPEAGVNPITTEKVEEKSRLDPVREYLARVSPDNFKEDFMASVSNDTVSAYEQYSTSTDAAVRLDAARLFHLSLNNAIVNRGDEKYVDFLADVQKDLEAALGQSLY